MKLKLNRKELLLFLAPALLLAVPLLFTGDILDKEQRYLAGIQAINCGKAQLELAENNRVFEDRAKVDACAVTAFKAKTPFIARYDTKTDLESDDSFGIVGTPQGKVYFLRSEYSSGRWKIGHSLKRAICPQPKLITYSSLTGANWPIVGCGTCSDMGSEDTANCLLNPLN